MNYVKIFVHNLALKKNQSDPLRSTSLVALVSGVQVVIQDRPTAYQTHSDF